MSLFRTSSQLTSYLSLIRKKDNNKCALQVSITSS